MSETPSPEILLVDDDPALLETMRRGLSKRGFEVTAVASAEAALERIEMVLPDAILSDVRLTGMNGLELCERVRAQHPDLPVILVTGFGSMETAIEALRKGAYDFLTKPVDVDLADHALKRAVERAHLGREVRRLRSRGRELAEGAIVGDSPAIRAVRAFIERVAGSSATVLVTGESGVGKELVARALHAASTRSDGPFVAVNCAALPEALLESELFGHAKGAFTDAKAARAGLFVEAHGGTLFLDEIGEIPMGMQAKLLRALQERRVRPVGADKEQPFDARIVAATNRDLLAQIEEGRFREDLYYRLAVLEVEVPPLRSRGSDVLKIAQRLLVDAGKRAGVDVEGFDPEAARLLVRYRWPGNVRELSNCIERAVAMARSELVAVEDLPARVRDFTPNRDVLVASDDPEQLAPLEQVEKVYILRVLDAVGGRRGRAAEILGVDRKTLYRKLERWGVKTDGD